MARTEELIRRSREGDKEARETLIEENMGLIHHVVKRFLGRGVEAEDLFQIGAIGLVKAVDRFDLSFDVRFSTYAVPMILGEVRRYLRDNNSIRVSRSLRDILPAHRPDRVNQPEVGPNDAVQQVKKPVHPLFPLLRRLLGLLF